MSLRWLWWLLATLLAAQSPGLRGLVKDASGRPAPGVRVRALDSRGRLIAITRSDAAGRFQVAEAARVEVDDPALQLDLDPVRVSVTVTARLGAAEETESAPLTTGARDNSDLRARPLVTLGNALESAPGVLVQQTAPAQVSLFLRGLTGYQVLHLVDGLRFNNTTFRSGPNQYLAWIDPAATAGMEAVLGPAGTLYGSDALGGTVNVLTPGVPASLRGESLVWAGSADRSAGASVRLGFGTARTGLLLGGSGRRHNDLRAGLGADSRHALRRFLGLDDRLIGSLTGGRLRDTAFTQSSAFAKQLFRPRARHSISGWYQYGRQDGADNYKDLWGGLGRLQSSFAPQELHFGYGRWEGLALAGLDSVSATLSLNRQADGSRRQGLLASAPVVEDEVLVLARGYTAQARKAWRDGFATFGGDLFDEHVRARRLDGGRVARPLYPDRSRYRTAGAYGQVAEDLAQGRLRLQGGLRWTRVTYDSSLERLAFPDLSFHSSAAWRLRPGFQWHAAGGRGFRAPNLNDLGAIGLNDLGYEIPASEAAAALLGDSAAEAALSLGRAVRSLKPESLWSGETGFSIQSRRASLRAQAFLSSLADPIVRRTLLFPASALPASLAGMPVTPIAPTAAQLASGVRTVAVALDPRAVKAFVNDGRARYSGVEATARFRLASHWELQSAYSILGGRDLHPNRALRRLPPQSGSLALRRPPSGRQPWWELALSLAGAQRRLSGGDRDDERIGGSRSRADIAAFFESARLAPWVDSSGRFTPTGETRLQIQDRLLPGFAATQRVPLYFSTAAWAALHLRLAWPLAERLTLRFALENALDKNYRLHGSGSDAPGRNAWLALDWRF